MSGSGLGLASTPEALTPADLAVFCRARGLAGFKVPRLVATQSTPLPANSAGKVLKAAVRALLMKQLAPAAPQSRM